MKKIEDRRVNLHGFIVVEKGVRTYEHYYAPFNRTSLHRMYSVAKTFASLGIGILAGQGKINLDDYVCDYFKEYEPEEGFYPEMKEMTIRDCLTMQSCHSKTTYKLFDDKDWVGTFFKAVPDHKPGCVFSYDTSAALVMGALVEKVSGMELLEFLRKEAFDEIGFSKESYMMKEPGGKTHAGSGLVCTLEDLLKVITLVSNDGIFEGKQLIPGDYLKEATSFQVSTALQGNLDEQNGYGYYFWRTRKNGYCMYGMGGQLALVFPDKELVFVCYADTQTTDGLSHLYDAFYDCIYED